MTAVSDFDVFLGTARERAELGGLAYKGWAENLAEQNQWAAALEKCAEGLKAYPAQDRLTNRIRIIIDAWAQPAMDEKNWDEAIRIYNDDLGYLADDSHLQHNKEYCVSMKEKK